MTGCLHSQSRTPGAGLYTRSRGEGPDVVLVHGWGMHSAVWKDVAEALADEFRVTSVDLPGHGRSPLTAEFNLAEARRQVLDAAPPTAVWVGWSLGGLVCLDAAVRHPERVRGLVLVAASPRFVRADGWDHAVDAGVLARFAEELERDHRATLRRFLALQTRGAEHGQNVLRRLREAWRQASEPAPQALRGGLAVLRETDLRPRLDAVRCPTLLLMGGRDTLVPPAAAAEIAAAIPGAEAHVFAGAGHAPFLSHGAEFTGVLRNFLRALAGG